MSTPTPAPGISTIPTAGPSSPAANPQSVNSNVSQFAPGGTNTGQAYFGTASAQGTASMFPRGGPQETLYGVYDPGALVPITGLSGGGPVYVDTTAAANMYYTWSQSQQDAFRSRMALIDSTALTATDAQMASAWASLVNQSAAYGAAGQKVTPWDILSKDIASNNGGRGKAGKDFTRTITTQAYTSAADANAVFTASAQSLLGRAPTADELTAFRNNLHGLEAANPIVKEINYHYLPGQSFYPSEDILKQSGGVSQMAQQNLALQQAKQNPEYGAYQAATTYMNVLKQAIGVAGGGLGGG